MKANKYIALVMMLAATAAAAQPRHFVHMPRHYGRAPHIVTLVSRPVADKRVINRLSKSDRLNMALAYLKANATLSKEKYSQMTGLPKNIAEAELDAFAESRTAGIAAVMSGKKKVYVMKRAMN